MVLAGGVVASVDGASASFLTANIEKGTLVSLLPVRGFAAGDTVSLPTGELLTLKGVDEAPEQLDLGQRLRVPNSYVVYSGVHTVEISPA